MIGCCDVSSRTSSRKSRTCIDDASLSWCGRSRSGQCFRYQHLSNRGNSVFWTADTFHCSGSMDYGTDRLKIECQMILRQEVTIEMPTVDGGSTGCRTEYARNSSPLKAIEGGCSYSTQDSVLSS